MILTDEEQAVWWRRAQEEERADFAVCCRDCVGQKHHCTECQALALFWCGLHCGDRRPARVPMVELALHA
jgi:hypothetical protein